MGTLGQYLRDARVARDIDLRDAAQQTRISVQYLSALEHEDFTKLPGEVFVKGFLKNYSRFLNLEEAEVMKRYAELKPQQASPASPAALKQEASVAVQPEKREGSSLEPFIWGAVIIVALFVFLFAFYPAKQQMNAPRQAESPSTTVLSRESVSALDLKPAKIYLEIVANEDTWLLVRTDDSPQKKAVLKKGDHLTWSADERFLLSYGRVKAVTLMLDGRELAINGAGEAVVRDLVVTRTGILNQPAPPRQARQLRPKSEPTATIKQYKPQTAQPQPTQPQAVQSVISPAAQPSAPASPAPSQPAPAEGAPAAPEKPAE